MLRPLYISAVLAFSAFAQVHAQTPTVLPRLAGPVVLDGPSDEAAWQAVAPVPLTMNVPVFEGPPTERTEIRVAYDDHYLYAALRAYDADPGGIRGNALSRDNNSESDDLFAVLLDTFNDNENALAFITTPAGIRVDQTIYADAQFDGMTFPINKSWNTFWDVATTVTDEGWFAEMRIPFSSLRFQDRDGRVVVGLMTWRWIARKSEGHTYPEAPPKWFLSTFKPSIMQDVTLEGVYSSNPLYITPYALGGLGQSNQLNDAGTAYVRDDDPTQDLGLDLKYGLTSNLTMDLTVNTDFAQVEADDQQVNLTRFSLFFPEKRLFFQERASIFDFDTGDQTRLFYSRRIGLSDDGPVRIYGGARLVGRVGPWDLGFLDMQTAADHGLPSENFGVLRLRRQVFNENSYAGGMVTSRVGTDGAYNMAYGVDGVFRVVGDDYLTFNFAQTFDDGLVQRGAITPFNTALLRAQWERRSNDGLSYSMHLRSVGPRYDPGVGFNFREDVTKGAAEVSYTAVGRETSPFFTHSVGFETSSWMRHADGTIESAEVSPYYFTSFKGGGFAFLAPTLQYEDLREPFSLSDDAEVLAGRYTFAVLSAFAQTPPRLIRTGLNASIGTFYDGWRASATLSPVWTASRHLELSADYVVNRVHFPDRDQHFAADIVRLRARAALNTHLSGSLFGQYNTARDAFVLNARLRYNFSEGHDLYVVYNEAFNTDRNADFPMLPLSDNRTVLVKYTYTVVM